MKKQTKTYVLLGLVALIWGLIGFRILGALSPQPNKAPKVATGTFDLAPAKERDTFDIVADYRDPFLGTLGTKQKKKTSVKRTVPKETVPSVDIRYTGFITDKNTRQKVFFLSINGQQHLMSAKDKIENVTLLNGTRSAVRVRVGSKLRTVTLTQ